MAVTKDLKDNQTTRMVPIALSTWEEFEDQFKKDFEDVENLKKGKSTSHISELLFRGHCDVEWQLSTTLERELIKYFGKKTWGEVNTTWKDLKEISWEKYHGILQRIAPAISSLTKFEIDVGHEIPEAFDWNDPPPGHIFCFSKVSLQKFPDKIREILIASATELTSFERKEAFKSEKQYLKIIKASGTKVITLTPKEKNEFKINLKPLVEKYRQAIGSSNLEMVYQILENNKNVADDEIIIGLDADLTSGSARAGLSIKRGMELAVDEINQGGGILGKKLRIISKDHSGISARGIENIRNFSKVKNLVAVMGGLHSPVALSELKIIHKENIIYLDPWAAATSIIDNGFNPNYVFRLSVRDEYAGPVLVREALNKGKKRVALLLENTGWGRSNHEAMINALIKENSKPVIVEWFNWGENDLTSKLKRIEAVKADIILLVANAPEGKNILETMSKELIFIPIVSHWGITGGDFGEELKEELEKISFEFLQTYSFLNRTSKINQVIIKKYLNAYQISDPKEIISPVGTAHAYDLIHLLAKAIRISGSIDRSIVREALENIKSHNGLVKFYKPPFSPSRHDALNSDDIFLAKYNKQGQVIPVSTETSVKQN